MDARFNAKKKKKKDKMVVYLIDWDRDYFFHQKNVNTVNTG